MKGIIAEINKKYAIVLTQDGSFKKIRTGPGMVVGAEIDFDQPSGRVKAARLAAKVSSIAAAALFILGLGYGTYSYTVPYSYVDIDINPSVELTANIFDKIIKAEALDEDGEALLSSGGLKNTELKAGVSILLNEAARQGYLNTEASGENTVLLTVTSKDEGKSLKLKEEVKEAAVSELQKNEIKSEVLVAEASIKQKNEAKKYGITPGRLALIEEAAEDEDGRSLDELKGATVRELIDKASKKKAEKEKEEKEKAKEEAAKEKAEKEKDKKTGENGGKSPKNSSEGNTGNSGNAGKVLEGFGQWKAVPNVGWIQGFAWPYGNGAAGYGGTGNGASGYGSAEKNSRSETSRGENAGKSADNSYNSRYNNRSEKERNNNNDNSNNNQSSNSKWSSQYKNNNAKNNDAKNKDYTDAKNGGKNGSQNNSQNGGQNNSGTGNASKENTRFEDRNLKENERLMDELLKQRERMSDELLKGKERLGNMLSGSEKKDQGKSGNQSVENNIGMWKNPQGNWNVKDQGTKSGVGSKKNYSTTKNRK